MRVEAAAFRRHLDQRPPSRFANRDDSVRRFPLLLITLLIGGLAMPLSAAGQEGAFAFRIRGGWDLPQGDFTAGGGGWQGDSGNGPNFGMGFTLPAPGPLDAYLGFGQRYFECDPEVCPKGKDWISTGFDVALRLVLGEGHFRGWLQGGLHTHRLEGRVLEPAGQVRKIASDGGAGVEAGAGLLISVGAQTSLSPGVHYGWAAVPFPDRARMHLRYLVLDLGILMGF